MTSRRRAVRPARPRFLWIAAHPDDEIVLAPLFGRLCVEDNADCAMLVFTRGERGACVLAGGCGDLGALRSAEMQRAAAALHARVTQWSFPDVMSDVEAAWGGHDALVAQLADAIAAEHPDVIYTFDPAHGSSCHPAHREVGQLVVDAAGATRVVFAETAIEGMSFIPATTEASAVDGSWSYVVNDARIHASQFNDAGVQTLESAPLKLTWIAERKPSSYLFDCVNGRIRSSGR